MAFRSGNPGLHPGTAAGLFSPSAAKPVISCPVKTPAGFSSRGSDQSSANVVNLKKTENGPEHQAPVESPAESPAEKIVPAGLDRSGSEPPQRAEAPAG